MKKGPFIKRTFHFWSFHMAFTFRMALACMKLDEGKPIMSYLCKILCICIKNLLCNKDRIVKKNAVVNCEV